MTKQQFLDSLKNKLKVLKEAEINDILDEYSQVIDNKIADGESEEKAVADFGNIDDLAREILDAYKINENYMGSSRRDNPLLQEIADSLSSFLEQTIQFLSGFFEGMDAEGAARIIVSLLIGLVVLFLMRIPFWIIEEIGEVILSIILPHFLEDPFEWLWSLIVNLGYLVFAVILITDIVKKKGIQFHQKVKDNGQKAASCTDSADTKTDSAFASPEEEPDEHRFTAQHKEILRNDFDTEEFDFEYEDEAPDEIEQRFSPVPKKPGFFSRLILSFFKIMMGLFLLPFGIALIVLCTLAGLLAFFMIQGAHVGGLVFLLAGIAGLLGVFINILWSLTQREKKLRRNLIKAAVSAVLLGFGTILFINDLTYFTIEPFPLENTLWQVETESTLLKAEENMQINFLGYPVSLIEDDTLDTQEIKVITHSSSQLHSSLIYKDKVLTLRFWDEETSKLGFDTFQKLVRITLEGLKNDTIYQLEGFPVQIEIRGNSETLSHFTQNSSGLWTYQSE